MDSPRIKRVVSYSRYLVELQERGVIGGELAPDKRGFEQNFWEAVKIEQDRIYNKRGRPRSQLGPEIVADVLIALRIDPRIRDILRLKAIETGKSVSDLIKSAILKDRSVIPLKARDQLEQGIRWTSEQQDAVLEFLGSSPGMSFNFARIRMETGVPRVALGRILGYLIKNGLVFVDHKQGLENRPGRRYLNYYRMRS